ncbi:MAG: glycosyltransferase [Acetobacteraceae bacterium]|nr:glycosyltransferase [Acetobacteraceae bacterium]
MRFSVVVTTRNRPVLLRRAIASILRQTYDSYEIVVVDDGSEPEFTPDYDAIAAEMAGKGQVHHLPPSGSGSGPSRARNHALSQCRGEFVAFLDDDDEWTDPDYLGLAAGALDANPACDLHLMNQQAVAPDGSPVKGPIWIEDLPAKLPPGESGTEWRVVTAPDLLRSNGFCHLNTCIIASTLLRTDLGGFDESIRYEEDRDLYLRAIEAARLIVYNPRVVSRHYVPDPRSRASASNQLSADERTAYRLKVLDKTMACTRQKAIFEHCRRLKGYALKGLATREASQRNFDASYRYAREGLATAFSYKWLGFVGWVWLRSRFRSFLLA